TQGHDTRRASSMVRGAGWREPNPRLRRRGKNVLDIPLYRAGVIATLRLLFARQAKGRRKLVLTRFIANDQHFI
ncbi:MAG: hypothetical protein ABSD89_14980, partial [Halobacteriota archaeon]